MRILVVVNRVVLTLLGLSTGAVKLAHMPAEMTIFQAAGFPDGLTVAFGVVQILGALMLLTGRTHKIGALILGITFVLATGVLFVNGMIPFGVFSLLFIAMAGLAFARPPAAA